MLIAPATASTISRLANGIANDIWTTTALACKAPKLIAPAMNPKVYSNSILQLNIQKLKEFGYGFIEPEYGVSVRELKEKDCSLKLERS